MCPDALTPRQREILRYISEHIDIKGFPPTRIEICSHFGFTSPNAAESHLRALARKGAIHLGRGRSRDIQVATPGRAGPGMRVPLPLVGRVAAGRPILAEENIEHEYLVDAGLFTPRAHYLLRVQGQSMRDAGILDGDLLAVHRTPDARDGQVVVARIEDEVTVKRFRRKGHLVSLLPANPEFEPLTVDLARQSLVIEGLGVGVIRTGLGQE